MADRPKAGMIRPRRSVFRQLRASMIAFGMLVGLAFLVLVTSGLFLLGYLAAHALP